MEAPKCCKKPMEVKAAVTWTSPSMHPTAVGGYNNTLILIYQCRKCGEVVYINNVI